MVEVSDVDFELFFRLSSLYEALAISATDPVVLKAGLGDCLEDAPGMFYDCYGDTEGANTIMGRRIEIASEDIRQHYKAHKSFLENFYSIDESINTGNRGRATDATLSLCDNVLNYLPIMRAHELRFLEDSFLHAPMCPPGHYFQIPDSGRLEIPQLDFNYPAQTDYVAGVYLNIIKKLAPVFRINPDNMPYVRVATQPDSGEGIIDTSLRGRLELNKELLRRVDFELSD